MDLKELTAMKQERAAISTKINALLDEFRGKDIPAEKVTELRNMEADFAKVNDTVGFEERALERNRALGETAPINEPMNKSDEARAKAFEKLVRNGDASEYRAMAETSTNGLDLVPTVLANQIIALMKDTGVMRKLATVEKSNSIVAIPTEANAVTAYWAAEAGALTESSPTFLTVTLDAYKATALTKISEELLQDSQYDVFAYLNTQFAQQFALLAEQEYINGTLSGRPSGVLADATFSLTSSISSSVAFNDIISLYTSVIADYRQRGSFLIPDGLLATFMTITDSAYTRPYVMSAAIGTPDTFWGKPIYTSPKMPTPATTVKGVAFGDFSLYKIMDRTAMTIQRLVELYAANGQVGFRGFMRTDGHLLQATAVKYMALK